MMKYLATFYGRPEIRPVEIKKETKACIYIAQGGRWQDRREAKISEGRGYFDTWSEARDFLLSVEEGKMATLTRELGRLQENVRKIQEMVE